MSSLQNIFNRRPQKNIYKEEDLYKFRKPIYVEDGNEALNRLYKKLTRNSYIPKKQRVTRLGGTVSRIKIFDLPTKNQQVMFKMSYSNTQSSHDKYVQYYMPQMDKDEITDKPVLFGMNAEEYERQKIPLNFKLIISPESQNVDLKTIVESYIKRVEMQTGYCLSWRGAIHSNTSHKHVHVVINGRDQNGKKVYFNKELIQMMRLMCSDAVTQQIGERTQEQIEAARRNYIKASRWTRIDEQLDGLEQIESYKLKPEEESRLIYLESLKLVKFDDKKRIYIFKKDWKDILEAAGRYNTYLEEWIKDPEIELYTGGAISGTVEKTITFDKDESWNDALILQTSDKKRIYIPVWQLHKENLEGKNISISDNHIRKSISRKINDKNIFIRE